MPENIFNVLIITDREVTQPLPDTSSIFQKTNYTEIRKQKNNVIYSFGNVHRGQRCMHSLSSLCSCVTETVHQTRYCRFVWHKRIAKCIPKTRSGKLSKNEMPDSVRHWTLVAIVKKKTSLHFDRWETTERLAWAGYNMTWPAWALL
jgi:hypothetical protein